MRVLVVDDSAALRHMLRVILEDAELEVEEACSGQEALDRLGRAPAPDVVVLDQRMPQMTGLEAARRLVMRGEAVPRLILFSAYLHPVLEAEASELGVVTVLKTDLHRLVGLVQDAGVVVAS